MYPLTSISGFLRRLHGRIGDLWWYSAMVFVACRTGDVINAFIGLWLVPRFVGPRELGAILPLQSLTSFLATPLAITAVVFAKYVNTYAARGEYGKVRCFIRDVLATLLALFALCAAAGYLAAPRFYAHLRVASGSLTALILLSGLVTNLGSVVSSALQGLKRFRTLSLATFLGAPARLATMLLAMPVRALSGYVLGQSAPGLVTTALASFDLHRVLKPHAFDPSWRRDLPEIWRYLWPYALCTFTGMFWGTVIATVYRERLPEIESSAYYLLNRFAETAGYVGCSLITILVPLASEAHEKRAEDRRPLRHTVIASLVSALLLAAGFRFAAPRLLALTGTWRTYLPYADLLPVLTVNMGFSVAVVAIASYEYACRRLGASVTLVVANGLWAAFLLAMENPTLSLLVRYGLAFNVLQFCFLVTLVTNRYGPGRRRCCANAAPACPAAR